ncbi:MAG: tetrahydrofolate dehydrogenase/cyclohydrolase catalytic domain-containing protein [Patescibacteria group bacterium]
MLLNTSTLQLELKEYLLLEASKLKNENKLGPLFSIIVGNIPEQESYVRIKKRVGNEVGIDVRKITLPDNISTNDLIGTIQDLSNNQGAKGIIIQQPLPQNIDLKKVYDSVQDHIEIEGHKSESKYVFPLVQACMIGLYEAMEFELGFTERKLTLPFNPSKELLDWLCAKKIVIAGNGLTTGSQIAKYFRKKGIDFSQTNSKTDNPDSLYKTADIIITGVGKNIINKDNIKPGVILLNFGLRSENLTENGILHKKLKGDYDEEEVRHIASLYTSTPGGLGPIDVLCLLGNHLEGCRKSI